MALVLSLLRMLIIVVLFVTLANLKQLIYQKFMFLKILGIYKKNTALKFSLFKAVFFYIFWFGIYKMVDNMGIYKSLIINVETVTKNPELPKCFESSYSVGNQLKNYLIY